MEFGFNEEQELIRSSIREFMAGECSRDAARELDEAGKFPKELLEKLADLGFSGLCVPEEFGGSGRDLLGAALVLEETGTLCPALAAGFAGISLRGGEVIAELGSRKQKKRFLPEIARGDLLFSHALSREGISFQGDSTDGFLLSGIELSISLGERADYLLVLARPEKGAEPEAGSSLFVIPADCPGLECVVAPTVGHRGSGSCSLTLESVRLRGEDILGGTEQQHQGDEQGRFLLSLDRLATAAIGVGIARGTFDYAADYANQRVQFGQPIADFEVIQKKFADVAMNIRSTRLLVYEACWRADQRLSFELEAAMAASRATALARQASLEALQILGGQGYMLESDVQRYLRDSLVLIPAAERRQLLECQVGGLLGIGKQPDWSGGIEESNRE
jgi:alkylation response protein AidB-like acyl-CoA dehydrogenase